VDPAETMSIAVGVRLTERWSQPTFATKSSQSRHLGPKHHPDACRGPHRGWPSKVGLADALLAGRHATTSISGRGLLAVHERIDAEPAKTASRAPHQFRTRNNPIETQRT
jgi:hypothetical protein